MKSTSNSIRTICEVGMFAALGFVFDELQGILSKGVFVNGGSIGFAMIAVLVIGYRRGIIPAILTGLLMGLLDIATSAYILNGWQLALDYILPYAVVGIAGIFKIFFDKANSKSTKITWLIVGVVVGGMLKFLSHYLAGIMFWADPATFAWDLKDMAPALYCFVYDIAFIGPSIILTGALLVLLYVFAPKVLTNKVATETTGADGSNVAKIATISMVIAGGLFLTIWYGIKYIKSYYFEDYGGSFEYDFDPDCMLITALSLFIVILGIISLIMLLKKKFSYTFLFGGLTIFTGASVVYAVARLLKMIVKQKAYSTYILWYYVGLIVVAAVACLFVAFLDSKEKPKAIEE